MHMEWVYGTENRKWNSAVHLVWRKKSAHTHLYTYTDTQRISHAVNTTIWAMLYTYISNRILIWYAIFYSIAVNSENSLCFFSHSAFHCGIELWQTFEQWISYYYCTSDQTFRQFVMNTLLIMWPMPTGRGGTHSIDGTKTRTKKNTKFVGLKMLIQCVAAVWVRVREKWKWTILLLIFIMMTIWNVTMDTSLCIIMFGPIHGSSQIASLSLFSKIIMPTWFHHLAKLQIVSN